MRPVSYRQFDSLSSHNRYHASPFRAIVARIHKWHTNATLFRSHFSFQALHHLVVWISKELLVLLTCLCHRRCWLWGNPSSNGPVTHRWNVTSVGRPPVHGWIPVNPPRLGRGGGAGVRTRGVGGVAPPPDAMVFSAVSVSFRRWYAKSSSSPALVR